MKPPAEYRSGQRAAVEKRNPVPISVREQQLAANMRRPQGPVPALTRYAAVRARGQRDLDKDPVEEYYDLSTLHVTADGARGLADREDERNRQAIRKGVALAHVRVARLRIEEVR